MNDKITLTGITSYTSYSNNQIKECHLNELNVITTKYGKLVPQYTNPGVRRKDFKAVSFYDNGNLKSVSLEKQTLITTTIGTFPAELLTFYDSGELHSLFPLNGQISFAWSEEEEGQLAEKYAFDFSTAKFTAKIIGLRFFENGKFQSIILWPGETAEIDTPDGKFPMRIGFRVYENGKLRSFEPAVPIDLDTPIGVIRAFDAFALGADADFNSVKYDAEGKLIGISTPDDIIVTDKKSGREMHITPKTRIGLMDDEEEQIPIVIVFDGDRIEINGIGFNKEYYDFAVLKKDVKPSCMGKCDGCSGCF